MTQPEESTARRVCYEYAAMACLWSALVLTLLLRDVDVTDATFMPRGRCGPWDILARNVYVTANVMIFAAYAAIALCLTVHTGRPRVDVSDRDQAVIRFVFGVFIVFCGVGHLEGVLAFYWPAYHLFAVWNAATACVSWVAVFVVFRHRLAVLSAL